MKEKKLASALVGQTGELVAADFLITKGYKLVQQNVRYKTGEIDLVMKKPNGDICFIEVKTKSIDIDEFTDIEHAYADPIEQLHQKKLHRLHKAIMNYVQQNNSMQKKWQLDAVVVLLDQENNKAHCKHLEHISCDI